MEDDQLLDEVCTRFNQVQIIQKFQSLQRTGISTSRRLSLLPFQDVASIKFAEKQWGNFWVPSEAKFERDKIAFDSLTKPEQAFLLKVLQIFSFQDGNVIDTLSLRFMLEAKTVEGKLFYIAQNFIESIHALSYALQLDTILPDKQKQLELMTQVNELPCLKLKNDLNDKYTFANIPLAHRQTAYASVEGIGFTSLFCCIFAFKERTPPVDLAGIFFSNQKISEDEAIHRDYGLHNVSLALSAGEITPAEVLAIVKEFVEVEEICAQNLLPEDIPNLLTQKQIIRYVHFVANQLLLALGLPAHWTDVGRTNPVSFMNKIGLSNIANFFEKTVGEYTHELKREDIPVDITTIATDTDF